MKTNHFQHKKLALITACAAMSLGNPVVAQENQKSGFALEEVIVTAQKREESVQDVPIAISAFSADKLAEKGVTNIANVSDFSPNIQIDRASPFAGSSTIISAFIRGIGQNDFAFNMEPGVGLYVDGVYYARTVGAAIDLLDVERVEVLKGPQGTLFGRNTIGGALHIVTRRPGDEFKSKLEVTVGEYNRLDIRGTMDVPLIDNKLYSTISFSSVERDGYQQRMPFDPSAVTVSNPFGADYTSNFYETDAGQYITARPNGNGGDTQGGENSRSVRAKFLYTPSDALEVSFAIDATSARESATAATLVKTDAGAFPFSLSYNGCIAGIDPSTVNYGPAPTAALNGICDVTRGPVGTPLSATSNRLPWGDHFITGDKDKTYATGSNFSDVDTWGINTTVNWDINDYLSLVSITSYRELESVFGVDMDGSPLHYLDTSFTMNQDQFSQEFQLNIDAFDSRLHSVVGLYYFEEQGDLLDTVTFASGLLQVYGPNDLENKAYAVFTHNNFAITDNLGLTIGLRYTEEQKRFTGGQRDLGGFAETFVTGLGFPTAIFPDPSDTELLFPKGENKKDFNDLSVRLGLEYSFGDASMVYASYAEGYKTGGWSTRLGAPVAVSNLIAPSAGIDPVNAPDHDSEEAATYEIGYKAELMDRRVRLNAAVFTTDYTNIQVVSAPQFTLGVPWFFNAGEAQIDGAELEIDFAVTENFVANASLGYLDAEYTSLDSFALEGGITKDNLLMNVPEESANIGGTYTFDLAGGNTLSLHADVVHKGKMARDLVNTPELIENGYTMTNMSLTFEPADSNWQVVLGGENITNERFIVTGNNNTGVGAITATYNRPATWYLTFRVTN